MIELQNEQLANCLSFDEETFNYPPGRRGPLLSKANLSLLATSLSQRPVCLRLPPSSSSCTSPLPPWVSHRPAPKTSTSPDSILFVKCSPKIWAHGERWKQKCRLPLKEKDQAGQFPLTFVPPWSLCSPPSTKATIGLARRGALSELPCLCPRLIHGIIDGNARLLSTTPLLKQWNKR